MFNNLLISGFATFLIYLIVEAFKSIRQFLIFKRVREVILIATFNYLKRTPKGFVDLTKLRHVLMEKLLEIKLSSWVKEINITWQSVDVIQFVFELEFEKIQPKYKFVIGLKEVEEIINRTKMI